MRVGDILRLFILSKHLHQRELDEWNRLGIEGSQMVFRRWVAPRTDSEIPPHAQTEMY